MPLKNASVDGHGVRAFTTTFLLRSHMKLVIQVHSPKMIALLDVPYTRPDQKRWRYLGLRPVLLPRFQWQLRTG